MCKVHVTEAFAVELETCSSAFTPDEAQDLAAVLKVAAVGAGIAMEDHIETTRRRGWVPPVAANGEAVL